MTGFSSSGQGFALLKRREVEVLELLSAHRTNEEIGRLLFISLPTVKHDIRTICKKLGATSRRAAARIALARKESLPKSLAPLDDQHQYFDLIPGEWSELTPTERRIVLLLGDIEVAALTERMVALRLNMRVGTLKKHLQRIYRKLDVANRTCAALIGARMLQQLQSAEEGVG